MKTFAIGAVVGALAFAQVQPPEVIHPGTTLLWDSQPVDVLGNPDLMDHQEIGVFAKGANVLVDAPVKIAQFPTTQADATALFLGLPAAEYVTSARQVDVAGNKSVWSNTLPLVWDTVNPVAPINLRIQINISVGTGGTP